MLDNQVTGNLNFIKSSAVPHLFFSYSPTPFPPPSDHTISTSFSSSLIFISIINHSKSIITRFYPLFSSISVTLLSVTSWYCGCYQIFIHLGFVVCVEYVFWSILCVFACNFCYFVDWY